MVIFIYTTPVLLCHWLYERTDVLICKNPAKY